jgi:hypothetical protein
MVCPSRRAVILGALAAVTDAGCGLFPKPRTPPLRAEDAAPPFALPDQNGNTVTLADLTRRGPAMLVFYRGYW